MVGLQSLHYQWETLVCYYFYIVILHIAALRVHERQSFTTCCSGLYSSEAELISVQTFLRASKHFLLSLIHALINCMSTGISQQMSAFKISFYHQDAALGCYLNVCVFKCVCCVRVSSSIVTSLKAWSVYFLCKRLAWLFVHLFGRPIFYGLNLMVSVCQDTNTVCHMLHLMQLMLAVL